MVTAIIQRVRRAIRTGTLRRTALGCALVALLGLLALVPRAGASALPAKIWGLEVAATSSIYQFSEHVPDHNNEFQTCMQGWDTTARANTVWRGSYATFVNDIPLGGGKHHLVVFGGPATDVGFGGSAAQTTDEHAGCGNPADTQQCRGGFTESDPPASTADISLGPKDKTLIIDIGIPGSRYTPSGPDSGSGCTDGHFGNLDTWWDASLKFTVPISALNPRKATHFNWIATTSPPAKSHGDELFAIPSQPLSRHDDLSVGGTSDGTLSMKGVLSFRPGGKKKRKGHHK